MLFNPIGKEKKRKNQNQRLHLFSFDQTFLSPLTMKPVLGVFQKIVPLTKGGKGLLHFDTDFVFRVTC